jgi:hypothetical protein
VFLLILLSLPRLSLNPVVASQCRDLEDKCKVNSCCFCVETWILVAATGMGLVIAVSHFTVCVRIPSHRQLFVQSVTKCLQNWILHFLSNSMLQGLYSKVDTNWIDQEIPRCLCKSQLRYCVQEARCLCLDNGMQTTHPVAVVGPLKAQWLPYVPPGLVLKTCRFVHTVYMQSVSFIAVLTTAAVTADVVFCVIALPCLGERWRYGLYVAYHFHSKQHEPISNRNTVFTVRQQLIA